MIVYRKEEKYILSPLDYMVVRNVIKSIMKNDSHSEREKGYWIRSLYFDTPNNTNYLEKIDGLCKRHKIRLRIYDLNTELVKLEIKNKRNDDGYKETTTITATEARSITQGEYNCLKKPKDSVALKVYYNFLNGSYSPKVVVDYEREAYYMEFNNIRITFDYKVRAHKTNDIFCNSTPFISVIPMDQIIMEVKYNNFLPEHIKHILGKYQTSRLSVSKYCLSRNVVG